MSTINKEPFIKKLLASCSDEELATLSTLVDGGGNQTPLRRTANPIATEAIPHITSDDMGIHLCNLTINYTNFLGYLIYTDDYCALISFTDAQVLKVFDLTESKVRPDTVDEAINILELRSALYEAKGGEGGGSGGGTEVEGNATVSQNADWLCSIRIGDEGFKVPDGEMVLQIISASGIPDGTALYNMANRLKPGCACLEEVTNGTRLWIFRGFYGYDGDMYFDCIDYNENEFITCKYHASGHAYHLDTSYGVNGYKHKSLDGANIFEVDVDEYKYNTLPSEIIAKVQAGDIIKFNDSQNGGGNIVSVVSSSSYEKFLYDAMYGETYIYVFDGNDNEWVYDVTQYQPEQMVDVVVNDNNVAIGKFLISQNEFITACIDYNIDISETIDDIYDGFNDLSVSDRQGFLIDLYERSVKVCARQSNSDIWNIAVCMNVDGGADNDEFDLFYFNSRNTSDGIKRTYGNIATITLNATAR